MREKPCASVKRAVWDAENLPSHQSRLPQQQSEAGSAATSVGAKKVSESANTV